MVVVVDVEVVVVNFVEVSTIIPEPNCFGNLVSGVELNSSSLVSSYSVSFQEQSKEKRLY